MVKAIDYIPAAVTISEEDDPIMYRGVLRRKKIGRVSVYQESAEKKEKSSRFIRWCFHQNVLSGIRTTFNIMRVNSAS
jgi:hypothetical protein